MNTAVYSHIVNISLPARMHQDGGLFLDVEKAFNRIKCPYLKKVIRRFEVGSRFRKWLDILYKDQKAIAVVEGHKTGKAKISR